MEHLAEIMINKTCRLNITTLLLSFATLVLSGAPWAQAKHPPKAESDAFKREEKVVLNLTQAPKSARWYIQDSLKATKASVKGIDKALHQVEQADATFARAKRHPDDRTMNATVQRLQLALKNAQQLQQQLEDANADLKSDVTQTLAAPR